MAKYIDADFLKDKIKEFMSNLIVGESAHLKGYAAALNAVCDLLDEMPADVEVATLQKKYEMAVAEREANMKAYLELIGGKNDR